MESFDRSEGTLKFSRNRSSLKPAKESIYRQIKSLTKICTITESSLLNHKSCLKAKNTIICHMIHIKEVHSRNLSEIRCQ